MHLVLFLFLASMARAEPVKDAWMLACHVKDTTSAWYERLLEAKRRADSAGLVWDDATCTVIVPRHLAHEIQWCDVDHATHRSKDYGIGEAVAPGVCRVAGQVEAVWSVAYSVKAAADRAEEAARRAEEASRQAWIIADEARGSATLASTSAGEARDRAEEATRHANDAMIAARGSEEDARKAVEAAMRAKEDAEKAAREALEAKEQARLARLIGSYQYVSAGVGFISQRDLVVVLDGDDQFSLRSGFSGTTGVGVDLGFAWPRIRVGTQLQGFLSLTSEEQVTETGTIEPGTVLGYGGLATLYGGRIFPQWEARAGLTLSGSMLSDRAVTTPSVTDAYFGLTLAGLYHAGTFKDDRTFLGVGPVLSIGLNQFATSFGEYEQGYNGAFFLVQLQVQAGGGPADGQPVLRGDK